MKTQLVHDMIDASFGVCAFVSEKDQQPTRYLMFCFPLVVTLIRACTGIGFEALLSAVVWLFGLVEKHLGGGRGSVGKTLTSRPVPRPDLKEATDTAVVTLWLKV